MKKALITVIFFSFTSVLVAQIGGVSNDKLIVVNPAVIYTRTVEFEPGFGYVWSKKSFDDAGKTFPYTPENDSLVVLQALAFRFTYGFAKNFEMGAVVTSSLDAFSLGMKYAFVSKPRFAAATFIGTTFNNESDLVLRNTGIFGKTVSIVGGFAFMNRFLESKRLSIDYDVQYQNTFDKSFSYADDIFSSIELGYEFKKSVQLITGLSYQFHNYKNGDPNAWLLTWNSGITIHPGEMFNLIVNIPYDIAGRNSGKFNGFAIILTIALN